MKTNQRFRVLNPKACSTFQQRLYLLRFLRTKLRLELVELIEEGHVFTCVRNR